MAVQLHGHYFTGSYDMDSLSRQANSLWVNKNAERYLDETLTYTWPESGNALAGQPDGLFYTLMYERSMIWIKEYWSLARPANKAALPHWH